MDPKIVNCKYLKDNLSYKIDYLSSLGQIYYMINKEEKALEYFNSIS